MFLFRAHNGQVFLNLVDLLFVLHVLALTIPDKQGETSDSKGNYDISVLIGGVMAGVVVVFIGIMLFVFLRR